jgi:hypothetical protein
VPIYRLFLSAILPKPDILAFLHALIERALTRRLGLRLAP